MEMSIFCKYAPQSSLVMSNTEMLQSELLTQEVLPAAERRAMRREAGPRDHFGVQSSESLAVHWNASLFLTFWRPTQSSE
jgi:hypothetical protein